MAKGNADTHIPNDNYRNNYDRVFRQLEQEDDVEELRERMDGDLLDEME